MSIAYSKEFLKSQCALSPSIRSRIDNCVMRLMSDVHSPGLNFERIEKCSDHRMFSVRVDDFIRIILVQDPSSSVNLLLWVGPHDEAYDWAKRHRCSVTQNGIQIYETSTIVDTSSPTKQQVSGIFNALSDVQLITLCVPKELIPRVRSFNNNADFYQAQNAFPDNASTYLSLWLEGESYEQMVELFELIEHSNNTQSDETPASEESVSFDEALKCPETLASFHVVESEEELARIMNKPLEFWRCFLHPMQRKIIDKNYNGSARVLGTAGTGKTVVAMHRAQKLAHTLKGDERILFTTFTRNLAGDIRNTLHSLCTPEEMKHIEVINLNKWVSDFLKDEKYNVRIIYGKELDRYWENAMTHAQTSFDISFFKEEWNNVVIPALAFEQSLYLKAPRTGRGTRLNRKDRLEIWNVFEAYLNEIKYNRIRDYQMAVVEATKMIKRVARPPMYKHIIVDESQDFSTNEFRLLRAIVGEPAPNDIFIVGDTHQRIYNSRTVLSEAGIKIVGRSQKLRINYRTTEETRKFAISQLLGIEFDDLDNEIDNDEVCKSLLHGSVPQVKMFETKELEIDFITQEINRILHNGVELNQSINLEDFCIITRTKDEASDYASILNNMNMACHQINLDNVDDRTQTGVRCATMHRVKGLEFRYVFIVGASQYIQQLSELSIQEKCLYYVALTRARDAAYITSVS